MKWYKNLKYVEELYLPIYIKKDNEYLTKLESVYNEYRLFLEMWKAPQSLLSEIESMAKTIIDSIKLYYEGIPFESYKKINSIINDFQGSQILITRLNKSLAIKGTVSLRKDYNDLDNKDFSPYFYKARVDNVITNYEPKQMLHIPFNMREKVATQRFSIPGAPCIYLGSSSYVCWLEMDKPALHQFNVSNFEISNNLRIFNLAFSWKDICEIALADDMISPDIDIDGIVKQMLLAWLLVCATSFKVEEENRNFKSEYIISQLIMQAVNSLDIDGIAYISKRIIPGVNGYPFFINLAFPAKWNINQNQYSKMCEDFRVTYPVNFQEYLLLKNNYNYRKQLLNHFNYSFKIGDDFHEYSNTEFYELDNYLTQRRHYRFFIDNTGEFTSRLIK